MDYKTLKYMVSLPTSNEYILSKIKTRIINYNDLKYFNNIDDVFINNSFIIFYPNKHSNVGHWCCCIKRNNTISYFDSYGLPPTDRYLNGGFPYLSKLLLKSPYTLEYSEVDYQLKKSGVSSCGHHCIVRILFKDRPLEEYQNFMDTFDNDDEVVTAISLML